MGLLVMLVPVLLGRKIGTTPAMDVPDRGTWT